MSGRMKFAIAGVVIGLILFAVGSVLVYQLVGHVRTRVDIWLDPFADPGGAGYQVVQALHAFARGGNASPSASDVSSTVWWESM